MGGGLEGKGMGLKGKGKGRRGQREKGKGTPLDLAEISLDQAPRARTYARTARHETISRFPPNLRYIYVCSTYIYIYI